MWKKSRIQVYIRDQGERKAWLCNKRANTKISDGQILEQKFFRWMKRSLFMKSNQDQSIAQWCSDGQQNVCDWKKRNYFLTYVQKCKLIRFNALYE